MARKTSEPKLWIRIDLGAGEKIGPGKIALLRAVDEHQSISAAARALKMSYRRAWLLIEALGQSLDGPVVETHVGGRERGGAVLTPLGRELLARYDEIQSVASKAATPALRRLATLGRRRG
ncbi:MAG: LysR family transcriptional regulator [Dongiaceae bacterium]